MNVLEGNNNFTVEDLKNELLIIDKNEVEEITEQTIYEPIAADNLVNSDYIFYIGSFVILLFVILSFADVGLTFISKFISFAKTLFDHVDLSFLSFKKK